MADYQRRESFQAVAVSQAESEAFQVESKFFGGLADTFQQYADKASGEAGQEVGLQEGMEATKTITMEDGTKKEVAELKANPLAGFTPFGDAYNKASEYAYESRMGIDFATTSGELRDKFRFDLQGFDKATGSFEKAYFKGMKGKELALANEGWAKYKANARGKVQTETQNAALSKNINDIYGGVEAQTNYAITVAGEGDYEGAIDALEAVKGEIAKLGDLGQSTKKLDAALARAYKGVEESFLLGGAEAQVAQGNYQAARDLVTNYDYMFLSKPDQIKLRKGVTGMIKDAEWAENIHKLEMTAEQEAAQARQASNLEIGVGRGQVGYRQIDQAADSGLITESKRTQLYMKRDAMLAKGQKAAEDMSLVNTALQTGERMDRENSDHKKAAEAFYTAQFGDRDILGEDLGAAAGFVDAIGIAPASMQSRVRTALRSGDPEQAMRASELVSLIVDTDRQLLDTFSDDDVAVAVSAARMKNTGTPPETAYAMAYAEAFPENPDVMTHKKDIYRKEIKDGNASDLADKLDIFDKEFIGGHPEATMEMQVEYDKKVESYYLKTGNEDTARDLAWNDMRRVWGATSINGSKQVMKYAPEADRPDIPAQWIESQFKSEVGENFILIADPKTARMPQGQRTWQVYEVMPNGDTRKVPGEQEGTWRRWKPSVRDTKEYQDMKKQHELSMKQLRERESRPKGHPIYPWGR